VRAKLQLRLWIIEMRQCKCYEARHRRVRGLNDMGEELIFKILKPKAESA